MTETKRDLSISMAQANVIVLFISIPVVILQDAHLKEPVEVNAYRLGAFMPGFILGILSYVLSLIPGNGDLFWFSLVHTSAAGMQVEDHPTNAGCYVLE